MITSDQGRAFIKGFEKLRLRPYLDEGGKWTVGYGHLMHEGDDTTQSITEDEAEALFDADLMFYEDNVNQSGVTLSQQQFDACVALAYNIGVNGFRSSTVLHELTEGNYDKGALAFLMWIKVTDPKTKLKRRSNGLMARRAAELLIFTNGDYGVD